jgi:hypothetical protein
MSTPENFTRRLRNLEAMWRRLDRGELTGRNCESSDRTRENTYRALRDAIRADANTDAAPLCAWLDANPKIAARWDRIERRTVGLPV